MVSGVESRLDLSLGRGLRCDVRVGAGGDLSIEVRTGIRCDGLAVYSQVMRELLRRGYGDGRGSDVSFRLVREGSGWQAGKAQASEGRRSAWQDAGPLDHNCTAYASLSGRTLAGKRLQSFQTVLNAFGDARNTAQAADVWLDLLPGQLTDSKVKIIAAAASAYALERPERHRRNQNTKSLASWLQCRGWEDYPQAQPAPASTPAPAQTPAQEAGLRTSITDAERKAALATMRKLQAERLARRGINTQPHNLAPKAAPPAPATAQAESRAAIADQDSASAPQSSPFALDGAASPDRNNATDTKATAQNPVSDIVKAIAEARAWGAKITAPHRPPADFPDNIPALETARAMAREINARFLAGADA